MTGPVGSGPVGGRAAAAADPAGAPTVERALSQAVRTPLHSLLGFLELLGMSPLQPDQRRLHDQLVDSAEDLLTGSDRVLWLVRLLGGQHRPRPARVHLAVFVAELAAESARPVSVVVAPDAPAHLETDLAALHRLVTELVTNAVVHGRAPVVLSVTPDGPRTDRVRITVSDAGVGLPAPVRQALAGPGAAAAPAGLGLLLVQQLTALLDGTLRVLPSAAGAHVEVNLPVSAAGTAPVTEPVAAPEVAAGGAVRPLHVLLVEDNATNRLLTERQLARLGHRLTAVATGEAGVQAALQDDVDVVLMDRHLPDVDGCEATRRISAALSPHRRYLPVIAVTADATADAREACAAAGMDEVLTKPVDLGSLSAALARAAAAIDRGDRVLPREGAGSPVPAALRAVVGRVDGDARAAAELVGTYLGELPGRRLRIQASLRRREPRAVQAAAESLRTSSESMGATAVAGTCAALAAAAATGDLVAAGAFVPGLLLQCERYAAELRSYTEPELVAAALADA
ncbi:response regulator [Geodermatophilus sp. DSM 44513]|uniref:response regulator n=1 Tax=Geodermatophilus sp. DSM 44513 TaxID=1528104 RepID=UPI00126C248A|nr:response regulator [Geodermatophilus sp. DSM 44513]WNV75003.1 response regulator [Geodermatophilus sp. DSM 44513]